MPNRLLRWIDENMVPIVIVPVILILMLTLAIALYNMQRTTKCASACAPADFKQAGELCFCRTGEIPWKLASPQP